MAFAYTKTGEYGEGDRRVTYGTFTNGAADEGGDILTELDVVEDFDIQFSGSAVVADAGVVNETLPLNSGTVTVVTTANADGYWRARGY